MVYWRLPVGEVRIFPFSPQTPIQHEESHMPLHFSSATVQPLTGKMFTYFNLKVSFPRSKNNTIICGVLIVSKVDVPAFPRDIRDRFGHLRRFYLLNYAHHRPCSGRTGGLRAHEWNTYGGSWVMRAWCAAEYVHFQPFPEKQKQIADRVSVVYTGLAMGGT